MNVSGHKLCEALTAAYGCTVEAINNQTADVKRMKRIAAANIIRVCRRPDGSELSDAAVAARVKMMLPSEVAAVRAELAEHGVLAEEVEHALPRKGGVS